MIVLDEQLRNSGTREAIAHWYPGRVLDITALRPNSVIKDEAISALLRTYAQPLFVTINATDFWTKVPADRHYCVACFPLPDLDVPRVPIILRRLLRLPEFGSKSRRSGKVARVNESGIWHYQVGDPDSHFIPWPAM